ncbi:hypothetical protein AWC38_SpisGene13771 [Stylophora pistillata]|uniref:Reverse transcriptase domain-containing protein n=1 Tax=Stylophora pistillata TaxID=50429 RepID=A0A2B4RTF9_STYPI|nr:hypothetical protein AWC38_SpisGene13771 [Stylophora pistillata]
MSIAKHSGKYKLESGVTADAIADDEEMNRLELELCKASNLVVAVGSLLQRKYQRSLPDIKVEVITPGIFEEYTDPTAAQCEREGFSIFVFGRGSLADFSLKGYNIIGKAVASLERKFELTFVGAAQDEQRKTEKSSSTKDEQRALKRLRNDENIVILPADKGQVTVVLEKSDYHNKMDALVKDKRTYEELKRDPTPALQRKLNSKLLTPNKRNAFDTQRYYRLRCSVPQPPKLYGLPKLHKPGFPMRPIVSFCGSPTYQLSKYLTTILQQLTDKSRHKLQSTEDFLNATKTVQIPDDYKLVSFDVKSLFTSISLQLALRCTETAIRQSTDPLLLPTDDIMDLPNICPTSTYFQYNGKHYKQLHGTAMGSPVSAQAAQALFENHTSNRICISIYKGLYGIFYKIAIEIVKSKNIE